MTEQTAAARKLIDHLIPDPRWGNLQGFLSTSYDLDPDFFEIDFLPSILGVDGRTPWNSRIAIEKRLSELDPRAVILTEGRRYRGRPRSLQLEFTPIVGPRGSVLHAKFTLLVFESAVRLLVGSANLTERGYRRNREIVAVLTAAKDKAADATLLREAIAGAERALSKWLSDDARRLILRAHELLNSFASPKPKTNASFCWSDRTTPLWRAFLDRWPQSARVGRISILSPFWSEDASLTLKAFIEELKVRGTLMESAEVRLLTDVYEGEDGRIMPVLPASYASIDWPALGILASAQAVSPRVCAEEVGGMEGIAIKRDLHAKMLIAEGVSHVLAYVGSANFTAHGWGFVSGTQGANVEAGILLASSTPSNTIENLLPPLLGDPVRLSYDNIKSLQSPPSGPEEAPWPAFILRVLLSPTSDDEELNLILELQPDLAPTNWSAGLPQKGVTAAEVLMTISPGLADSRTRRLKVALSRDTLNRLLLEQEIWIFWPKCPKGRAVPINVNSSARDRLPISPGQYIGENQLISYYQGRISWEDLFPDPESPIPGGPTIPASPLSFVDKSNIQSYQVREFVEALAGIREELRNSTHSERAMCLALRGPISPLALAKSVVEAVKTGHRTPLAAGFQLVEIAACLTEAHAYDVRSELSRVWGTHLKQTGDLVTGLLLELSRCHPEAFSNNHAFRRYKKAVLRRRAAASV